MGTKTNYGSGKKSAGENRGKGSMDSKGTCYSYGKNSSIAKGISTGRTGSTKIDVGYSAGQKDTNRNASPDPKSAKVFKPGGRS